MLTKSGIKLGIGLPQAFPDGRIDMDVVERTARRSEDLGFDDFWTVEQIVGSIAVLEPVTMLSYLAAITTRVRLGTSVLVTNLRNPVQLAKALSSLDQLSRGRLIAGIGLGTNDEAYAAFGIPTARRLSRFVEGVEVMRALWMQREARHDGRLWQLDDVSMEPKPVQGSIPLWFGARAPASLTRAVDMADGWMGAGSTSIADTLEHLTFVRRLLAERGRDEGTFGLSKRVYMAVDTDAERAREKMREWVGAFYGNPALADRWAVTGTPDQVLPVLESLRDAGARHLLLNPVFDYDRQLDLIASEIAPAL